MSCQLPADCLNEIFEYLEQDKVSLHSCLLVNRLWCEISVRILWRDIWRFVKPQYQWDVSLQIISTLVACLPNESKDLLHKNRIFITTQRSLFNYASFCKVLSIHKIDRMIRQFFVKQYIIDSPWLGLDYDKDLLISQEILKMFMEQISTLRTLEYLEHIENDNIMFTYFPEAKNCLTNLTELTCSSNIQSDFFYQLSQICHNIQSLTIRFISSEVTAITSSLTKFSSTLIKLKMNEFHHIPSSFIATFKNLRELILTSHYMKSFNDFNSLQHVTFPQLKVLKFINEIPKVEALIKFLELNGKNLKEFCVGYCNGGNSLYLAVAKFCPNIQTLGVILLNNEIDSLKVILNSCQYLESVKVWCGQYYLHEEEVLEVIAKHSPKNFYELKLDYVDLPGWLLSKNLETFLISWNNRIPQRSLSLIIIKDFDNLNVMNDENMKLIEKYKKLGIIKKFKFKDYDSEEDLFS